MADTINTAILDKAVDRAAMNRLYEANTMNKLDEILKEHSRRTSDIILATGREYREKLDKEIKRAFGLLYQTNSRALLDLAQDQMSYTFQTLETSIGNIWRTAKPSRSVAENIVFERPLYNDLTLLQGWSQLSLGEKKRIELLIRRGISQGMDEKQLALLIRQSNIFKITRNQSFGLARTAMTSVYAQADHEVYKVNEKALNGYEYVAVLDSRTTPTCSRLDGKIFPIGDTKHLPPQHWHCRSTTIPVVKKYEDLGSLEGIAQIRKRNLAGLSEAEKARYDGMTPLKESYSQWLLRQPQETQLKHLGDLNKVEAFQQGLLSVDKFQDGGRAIGIQHLRELTDPDYGVPGDTRRFAFAKQKLDTLKIGASSPDDFLSDSDLIKNLREYYLLQAGELDGTLSYTNYRGNLLHTKKATRRRVLTTPPTEEQLKFNPITRRYEDVRLYQPMPAVLQNNLRQIRESTALLDRDKEFLEKFIDSLEDKMGVNERAVVADNLRILFTRFRQEGKIWQNFKAVSNAQMKFDVMNVSEYMETQLRRDSDLFARLKKMEYFDPVLGAQSFDDLSDNFINNIFAMREWEYKELPKVAKRLRNILDLKIPTKIRARLDENDLEDFYLKYARMLASADSPDRDQLAISLGRSLYNAASYRGTRNEWYNLGTKLLDDAKGKGLFEIETFGVQKKRMKSRMSGQFFGPYYDTLSYNIRIVDPKINEYAALVRKVEVGMRVPATDPSKRLYIRPGFKTYFDHKNRDTGIPILSEDSVRYFPVDMIDDSMAQALNHAGSSQFKIEKDFHDAIERLLFFKDDKGKAAFYDDLNHYKKYIASRGDSYERFKAMKWLSSKNAAFTNNPFLDHRGRIYDRGFISPQSGESFRPFLSTAVEKNFSKQEFLHMQDHIGSFLGGLSDKLEGNFNGLTVLGRQKIAEKWRKELVSIGNHLRRGKPNDIRLVLTNPLVLEVDGEEQGKLFRFAFEMAKIDEFLEGNYRNLDRLQDYKIGLALEQDASSSGAQIIALTTRNKQLAELSNVVPTNQKQRLYDIVARLTYDDPRFKKLNEKLGLTEKDLRKA